MCVKHSVAWMVSSKSITRLASTKSLLERADAKRTSSFSWRTVLCLLKSRISKAMSQWSRMSCIKMDSLEDGPLQSSKKPLADSTKSVDTSESKSNTIPSRPSLRAWDMPMWMRVFSLERSLVHSLPAQKANWLNFSPHRKSIIPTSMKRPSRP